MQVSRNLYTQHVQENIPVSRTNLAILRIVDSGRMRTSSFMFQLNN